jgi:hypothetical protein
MSLPYPHDRARKRQEDGPQPFKDAREDFGQSEAEIQRDAPLGENMHESESDEQRHARHEAEAEERFKDIGDQIVQEEKSS